MDMITAGGWDAWLADQLHRAAHARAAADFEAVARRRELRACLGLLDRRALPDVAAKALVVVGRPGAPLVLVCHDLDGSPEAILASPLGRALQDRGFGLVVPRLAAGWRTRLRLARQARLLGLEWLGLEVHSLQRLIDQRPDAVWAAVGYSRGGQTALLLAALDERIQAVAVASWFADRDRRLTASGDDRLAAFIDSPEDEQFLPGWSRTFDDVQLAALVAPRPLLVTSGLDDPILPWEDVERSADQARRFCRRLGRVEHLRLRLEPVGHEPLPATTADWLSEVLSGAAPCPVRGALRSVRAGRERRKRIASSKRIRRQ